MVKRQFKVVVNEMPNLVAHVFEQTQEHPDGGVYAACNLMVDGWLAATILGSYYSGTFIFPHLGQALQCAINLQNQIEVK